MNCGSLPRIIPASEFAANWAYTLWNFRIVGACHLDAIGALERGQFGLIFEASRTAVLATVDAFLSAQGHPFFDPGRRIDLLRTVVGEDDARFREAQRLLTESPTTQAEVQEFMTRCFALGPDFLGLEPPRVLKAYGTPEEREQYVKLRDELGALTRFLGIESPSRTVRSAD